MGCYNCEASRFCLENEKNGMIFLGMINNVALHMLLIQGDLVNEVSRCYEA